MLVRCIKCKNRFDLEGATAPGAKLRARKCPGCKCEGTLRRVKPRDIDAIRAHVGEIVNEAAASGTLPDGSPVAPGSMLGQLSSLHGASGAGAPGRDRKVRWADVLSVQGRNEGRFLLAKQTARAAVIQARAVKRELRIIASACSGILEVGRALVTVLGEKLEQLYAAANVLVEQNARREARDVSQMDPERMGKWVREYLETLNKPAERATEAPLKKLRPETEDLRGLAGRVVKDPTPGDVLDMPTGDTWRVLHCDVDAVHVQIEPGAEGGGSREIDVARAAWPTVAKEAKSFTRHEARAEARDFTNAHTLDCGPRLDSHARRVMALSPQVGDVLVEHDGERYEVLAVSLFTEGPPGFRVHWRGPEGEGWSNNESWGRKVAKAESVLPAHVTGEDSPAAAAAAPEGGAA